MKKIVLVFGLVIGAVLCANMIIMINLMYTETDFKGNDVVGYAAMVVLFSLIYIGVRSYRNKQLEGYISFGRAFKTGASIALVASTLYVVVGLSYYYLVVPDFLDVYTEYVLRTCAPEDMAAKTAEMENFKELYKNPLFAILISYAEVLPVGLIVAFVSSLFLKRKSPAA